MNREIKRNRRRRRDRRMRARAVALLAAEGGWERTGSSMEFLGFRVEPEPLSFTLAGKSF
jgi:hypothetical protein